jgi:hypothetical protein
MFTMAAPAGGDMAAITTSISIISIIMWSTGIRSGEGAGPSSIR